MNERIKLLAEQARKYAWENETHWSAGPEREALFEQKFALLIVRECVEHLEGTVLVPNIEHSRTKTKCIRSIKEHFGVEE